MTGGMSFQTIAKGRRLHAQGKAKPAPPRTYRLVEVEGEAEESYDVMLIGYRGHRHFMVKRAVCTCEAGHARVACSHALSAILTIDAKIAS